MAFSKSEMKMIISSTVDFLRRSEKTKEECFDIVRKESLPNEFSDDELLEIIEAQFNSDPKDDLRQSLGKRPMMDAFLAKKQSS